MPHTLHRTPGKLIAKKDESLPGVLGAYGEVWGKLSLTGDEAEKLVGFRPKKGAKGILLTRREYIDDNGNLTKGTFVTSLMPRKQVNTKKLQATHEKTRVISKLASKHLYDIIHPIWKDYNRFMSVNMRRVKISHTNEGFSFHWDKLMISDGDSSRGELEPPPRVPYNWYDPDTKEIKIISPNLTQRTQIGIALFDKITGSFFHISPNSINSMNSTNSMNSKIWKLQNIRKHYKNISHRDFKFRSQFYIYAYYRQRNSSLDINHSHSSFGFRHSEFIYSPSVSSRVLIARQRKDKQGRKPIIISIVGV